MNLTKNLKNMRRIIEKMKKISVLLTDEASAKLDEYVKRKHYVSREGAVTDILEVELYNEIV